MAITVIVPTLPQTVLINGQATLDVTLAAGVNEPLVADTFGGPRIFYVASIG